MTELMEAVLAANYVAAEYRLAARNAAEYRLVAQVCPRSQIKEYLRKADEWTARTNALLTKVAEAAAGQTQADKARPLPVRRRD
jgi:hypothetical protein